jgi:hypothetical protein
MEKKKVKRKPHWYKMYYGECPVCGSSTEYRERVLGKKPKDSRKRYVQLSYTETYDHCVG